MSKLFYLGQLCPKYPLALAPRGDYSQLEVCL